MAGSKTINRVAIVIIHGIGEQRPMATLRSFAGAIRKIERNPGKGPTWSKPDSISDGFEHRCFTIPQTRTRPITDVYELYWAHLFDQTKLTTLAAWLLRILLRPLAKLPKRYRRPVLMLRLGLVLITALALLVGRIAAQYSWIGYLTALPIVSLAYAGLVGVLKAIALDTVSDAARYLDASPRNVEARNKVRKLGVDFLDRLHKSDKGYSRIILCGHSLGSVIGYDILQRYWFAKHAEYKPSPAPVQDVLKHMEKLAKSRLWDQFRQAQRTLWAEQRLNGNGWRITDFVTMGSPLAHADLLMADSVRDFISFRMSGELTGCPPCRDPVSGRLSRPEDYTLSDRSRRTMFLLRDNAAFAVTRWTNIHFNTRFGLFGDPISGPLCGLFGKSVTDYAIKPAPGRWFAHSDYWQGQRGTIPPPEPPVTSLDALALALELDLREIETTLPKAEAEQATTA